MKPPPPPQPPSTNPKKSTSKQYSEPEQNTGIVKEDLICKILKYQNNKRFGSIIKQELGFKYTRPQLAKNSIDSLETILHRIRTHLNTRNMDKVFEHMAKVTAKGYEDLVTGFGYNIEGFSELLMENPAFHDAFERWKIERKIPDVPPSFQLMYIIASTTYVAHTTNKGIQFANQQKLQPPPKPVISKTEQTKPNDERIKSNFKPGDIII